jgi:predicted nucleic acid-binding protein
VLAVDACVAGSVFLSEHNSREAEKVLFGGDTLVAPHFFLLEVTQLLWTSVKRGRITPELARRNFEALFDLPIDYVPDGALIRQANGLAQLHDIAVYDTLYVALAIDKGIPLITSDNALCAKLRRARLANLRYTQI